MQLTVDKKYNTLITNWYNAPVGSMYNTFKYFIIFGLLLYMHYFPFIQQE